VRKLLSGTYETTRARGPAVVTLQNKLKAAGFNPGAADGAFGPNTPAAVKAFQKVSWAPRRGTSPSEPWHWESRPCALCPETLHFLSSFRTLQGGYM
jgi:hypothetical protein